MKKQIATQNNSITSYIDNNRDKIDETLVSLRIMKQIDVFMELNEINQKEIAKDLETSQAFISQLMSGSKKLNMSFINKFEKTYDVEFKFLLCYNKKISQYSITSGSTQSLNLKSKNCKFIDHVSFSSNVNSKTSKSYDFTDIDILFSK